MTQEQHSVLALNGGSSSLKFAVSDRRSAAARAEGPSRPHRRARDQLHFQRSRPKPQDSRSIGDLDHRSATNCPLDWLDGQIGLGSINAVGHRVVTGGANYNEPHLVTKAMLDELRRISAYAPEYLLFEIVLIDLFRERLLHLPQVACFDTGDLDSGLVWYLAQPERMIPKQFHQLVNHESGMRFVSETSSDLRDLLGREANDVRAAEAVAPFCYQVKKWIRAFAAALGGLDTLAFAGGIGENAHVIRARICEGLGVQFDANRNAAGEAVIAADASPAQVRVIRTDKDVMIAKAVFRNFAGTQTIQHAHGKE